MSFMWMECVLRYDRCPDCRGPMSFHAITSVKGVWRRWLECSKCQVYVHTDQFGTNAFKVKSAPPKNALARNEVLPDAGTAADRFGQDYLRDLPGVQRDWVRGESP